MSVFSHSGAVTCPCEVLSNYTLTKSGKEFETKSGKEFVITALGRVRQEDYHKFKSSLAMYQDGRKVERKVGGDKHILNV